MYRCDVLSHSGIGLQQYLYGCCNPMNLREIGQAHGGGAGGGTPPVARCVVCRAGCHILLYP